MSAHRSSPIQTLLQGAANALDLNWNLRSLSSEKEGTLRERAEAWLDRAIAAAPTTPDLAACADDMI